MTIFILRNAIPRINLKWLLLLTVTLFLIFLQFMCDRESPIKPPSSKGSIYGVVIDALTSLPIDGAIVIASKNQVTDTTDSLGSFTLIDLSIGQETLTINAEGYETKNKVVEVKPDSQWIEITLNRVAENLYLYVGTAGGNDLFVVDVDFMQKVDSLYFAPGHMQGLYITPGGTKLYITQGWPDSAVYYLDTKSRTYHPTSLFNGFIRFSESEEGFFFRYGGGIFNLDTLTDRVTQIDTVTLGEIIAFDKKSPIIYYISNDHLYSYDYYQKKITDSLSLPPAWNKAMTPDNSELYFTTPNGYLGVINIQSDAVEYITYANPNGEIAVTPDGQYVFVTDPGSTIPMSQGSGFLIVVKTSDHSLDGYIDVNPIAFENPTTSRIVITHSSNYAFAANSFGGDVFVTDNRQRKAIKRIDFRPIGATIGPLVLGTKPKL
ncbi:MAG: carboxypeptidase regulatory-like domain-containing protein [archaeon]